ncbi:hypothetical protein EV668_0235 [Enterovirga rhinocerotis]|uniref:Uncharacterized protein n=1 Tax=Enterovirga rhinocerotis TaxID=1339210 RepID=A0A4R7C3D7_9HYPH|nr:hypothetical protein EV668_0235 [Enterovirga rhinocerotis]
MATCVRWDEKDHVTKNRSAATSIALIDNNT